MSNIQQHNNQLQSIFEVIRNGYRIMIILRGAPGTGKSHLAKFIIDQSAIGSYEDHIFATDDFFYDKKRLRYIYNSKNIPLAHRMNQSRVKQRALAGWSPIIVDNTNMRAWEMLPYVNIALENGYILHILEPNATNGRSAHELAMSNNKGVPEHVIQRMLDKYEEVTLEQLLEKHKLAYGKRVLVPMLRKLPPINDGS